ncbi:MAG: cytochrome c [Gammaproteobacteria bacterium]|nr:cytochrome c [Gammaproteobacteria bacterium]MDH3465877.1 cytochrome c [Gammaproteobacteria bacterium]
MIRKCTYVLFWLVMIGLGFSVANADEVLAHETMDEQHDQNMMQQGHGEGQMHGHSDDQAHHRHDNWIDPPQEYANKESHQWTNVDAIKRGEAIYKVHCKSCHGAGGQGTGPLARSLSHQPADLTNNFHTSPGTGDAYLFWRVTEGGAVEPFKSQESTMPAFKSILNASERWDVLAYVHTFFHQGLAKWSNDNEQQE